MTLQRSGRPPADLVVTVDARTTVGDLADHLVRVAPGGAGPDAARGVTLALVGRDLRALDRDSPVSDSGLRSGDTVSLTPQGGRYRDAVGGTVAVVTVLAGPDIGREFDLTGSSAVIGRERGCEIRLTDPQVSRRHARLTVSDVTEIVDLGSANGIVVDGDTVTRTVVRPTDRVRLGDSVLAVRVAPAVRTATGTFEATSVGFVRPPRLDPVWEGSTLTAPEPPERQNKQRFPVVSLLAPLVMGALLYLVTRSTASLLFVALSPLMLVGNAVEGRLSGRSAYRKALAAWRVDVADLVSEARALGAAEATARREEFPAVDVTVRAAAERSPLLWTRRPDERGFVEVRLGSGALPSRTTFDLPAGHRAPREVLRELAEAVAPFGTVADVPVVARPADAGGLGVAGPRVASLGVARAVVAQLAALHSPADLALAGIASSRTAEEWDWLKWLPHTDSVHTPLQARSLASTSPVAAALVSELEALVEARSEGSLPSAPVVVVVVEHDAPVEHARLVGLGERGWRHGVHLLWLAADVTRLPAACRTFVTLDTHSGGARAGFVGEGLDVELVPDTLDAAGALDFARRLAPVVDIGARVDDESDLPRSVSLLALNGPDLAVSPAAVIERWTENRSLVAGPYAPAEPPGRAGTLRAVVGQSAAGPFAIDLRADGPHALVGGTTGSGKSELLQAWILAMAAAHSPQRLTFLLVDYKGGAAFSACEHLPHTVGLVTDLRPHMVRRALTSLAAELRHREHLLAEHRAKDLPELERRGVAAAPPSLVLVVDEFAALVEEVPGFVDGVVNVAQRGRSLGLHLILATQQPSGVIRGNLRANTNLRLALRVADEADSSDVIGAPQAAFFPLELPGRAMAKSGPGRLVPFQTGYAGGHTPETPPPPDIAVETLAFGPGELWTEDRPLDSGPVGRSDIDRLVDTIREASDLAAVTAPRRPWLPDLRAVYDLGNREQVPTSRVDDRLVFGVGDDPDHQAQPVVAFRPDRDGNLAVYGTGGSGKSTLLRSVAVAAGFSVRQGPCHVYGLDFGSRGLAMLEVLPHVGAVVTGSDHERITRLLDRLRATIDDRAAAFHREEAGSIVDYRRRTGEPLPRVILLVDGITAFRQAYESTDRQKVFDQFVGIAADGRPVGVHVVVSSDQRSGLPSALASAIQLRVVLRMASVDDYAMLGVPADVLAPDSPPGRGLLDGSEVQVAMLAGRDADRDELLTDVGAQSEAMRRFAESMVKAGAVVAPPVERLAERVGLAELPPQVDGRPVLGVSGSSLSPATFSPRGSFLVSGPPGSGRSTALATIARTLRRLDPGYRLHYFGSRRSPLVELDLWTAVFTGSDVGPAATLLAAELPLRPAQGAPTAVFVENIGELAGGPHDAALQELAKVCLADDHFLVAEGETSTLTLSHGLLGQVKSGRAGLALSPDQADGSTVFRTPFPRTQRADFVPGRGLLVGLGRTEVVQVAAAGPP